MKSLIVPIVGLAKTKTLSNLSVVILGVISPLAFADVGTWSLDSTISSARLFQGSAANPDSVNTSVARVTGKVKLLRISLSCDSALEVRSRLAVRASLAAKTRGGGQTGSLGDYWLGC
jgi:hypothetical protein